MIRSFAYLCIQLKRSMIAEIVRKGKRRKGHLVRMYTIRGATFPIYIFFLSSLEGALKKLAGR